MSGSFSTLRGTTIKPKDVKPFWSTFYTNSGFRKGVNWFKNNDFAGGLGGYFIYGYGGYNMGGRTDIKGEHKVINANDMAGPGAGGAATTSGKALNLLQYLNGAFGLYTKEGYKIIKENNDTIWIRVPVRPGSSYSTIGIKLKKENEK